MAVGEGADAEEDCRQHWGCQGLWSGSGCSIGDRAGSSPEVSINVIVDLMTALTPTEAEPNTNPNLTQLARTLTRTQTHDCYLLLHLCDLQHSIHSGHHLVQLEFIT